MIELVEKQQKHKRDILRVIWGAIDSANPESAVRECLKLRYENLHVGNRIIDLGKINNVYVIGAGKASPIMAKTAENILMRRLKGGLICTKYGHSIPLHNINIMEADYPIPDKNSQLGAQRTLRLVGSCKANDLIICMLSEGASALWSTPRPPIKFEDKKQAIEALLTCGADIHEINTVLKHISNIKGGMLAEAAQPAMLITLAISDVVGDQLPCIGSGPTTGDPTTFKNVFDIVNKYDLLPRLPSSVSDIIWDGYKKLIKDTPKPSNAAFSKNIELVIGSNKKALEVAQQTARYLGYKVQIVSSQLTGEAKEVGPKLVEQARKLSASQKPGDKPWMLLSGGETTVTLSGNGKGGRNQEMVLVAAIAMDGIDNMTFASISTDGADGLTDAAGAIADGSTMGRGKLSGHDAHKYLANDDSYNYFKAMGDLIKTGPTGTNVMDIQVLIIE